jgi:hypothetical protein
MMCVMYAVTRDGCWWSFDHNDWMLEFIPSCITYKQSLAEQTAKEQDGYVGLLHISMTNAYKKGEVIWLP